MSRRGLAAVLIAVLLLTTGCWDYRPLSEAAFALGMALDRDEDGQLLITVQFPQPGVMKGMGGQAPSGDAAAGSATQFFNIEGRGPTFTDALADVQRLLSRPISFGHLQVVLLGAAALEHDAELLQQLLRFAELDNMSYLFITRGTAGRILRLTPPQERLPALYLTTVMDSLGRTRTQAQPTRLLDALVVGLEPGRDVLVTVIGEEQGQFSVDGLAVLRGFKLGLFLSAEESRALLAALGKTTNGTYSLKRENGKVWAYRRIGARSSHAVLAGPEGNRLLVNILIEAEVSIAEGGTVGVSHQEMLAMETALSAHLKRDVEAVLRRLQTEELDPIGFYARRFTTLPGDEQWRQTYRKARLVVNVTTKVKRKGKLD